MLIIWNNFYHISLTEPTDVQGLPQILPQSAKFSSASMLAALAQYSISEGRSSQNTNLARQGEGFQKVQMYQEEWAHFGTSPQEGVFDNFDEGANILKLAGGFSICLIQ